MFFLTGWNKRSYFIPVGDGCNVVLALLGTVGFGSLFVKIKVVLKAFCVVEIVVVGTCCVVVVVVVVAVVISVVVEVLLWAVTGCPAVVLGMNGADVAGAKFSFGVSLPVVFVIDSPEKK